MNIHGLQVSSSSLRDILRLERSLQHLQQKKKKPNLIWQFHVLFQSFRCSLSSLAVIFFGGRFFGAYWHFLSVETVCKLFKMFYSKWETELRYQDQLNTPPLGWRKIYSCCILTPMPWARLHPTISPSLKRKRICYSFILSKLVYHFTMVTLQKHHYTNNPTTKNTFIIAHVAILMAREGIH